MNCGMEKVEKDIARRFVEFVAAEKVQSVRKISLPSLVATSNLINNSKRTVVLSGRDVNKQAECLSSEAGQ